MYTLAEVYVFTLQLIMYFFLQIHLNFQAFSVDVIFQKISKSPFTVEFFNFFYKRRIKKKVDSSKLKEEIHASFIIIFRKKYLVHLFIYSHFFSKLILPISNKCTLSKIFLFKVFIQN